MERSGPLSTLTPNTQHPLNTPKMKKILKWFKEKYPNPESKEEEEKEKDAHKFSLENDTP